MKTMKAVLYEQGGRAHARIGSVPYPTCGDDDVIIKVMSAGICKGADSGHDDGTMGMASYPLTPGHEFAGYVHEIGKNVKKFRIGDRVVADNTVPCDDCYYCRRNLPNYCDDFGSIGNNLNGGFAEYAKVSRKKVFAIPDSLSFNAASLAEPVACCMNAMDRLNVRFGDEIVVFGAGPNGMILAQLIHHSSARKVVVVASTQSKLDTLQELGIETIFMDRNDYSKHEAQILALFPNGVDAVVDATANVKVISEAFKLLKKGGRLLQYSVPHGTLSMDPCMFSIRELSYIAACCQTHHYDRSIAALSDGVVNGEAVISAEYALDDYFEALDYNVHDRNATKVIIHPNTEA